MAEAQGNALLDTLGKIFANNQTLQSQPSFNPPKNRKINKRDLELAMTVLLVDLASCDEKFQPEEYQMIANGLRRLFGTNRQQVQELVNQANGVLRNLRGTSSFASQLKENLGEEERFAIMEVIEDIIHADGVVDGFEIYLKHKLAGLLGLPIAPKSPDESNS